MPLLRILTCVLVATLGACVRFASLRFFGSPRFSVGGKNVFNCVRRSYYGLKIGITPKILKAFCVRHFDFLQTTGVVILLLLMSSCYHSPQSVARMDEQEIGKVSDWDVCNAWEQSSSRTPVVLAEEKKRGLDCKKKIADYRAFLKKEGLAGTTQSTPPSQSGTNHDNSSCTSVDIVDSGIDMYQGLIPVHYVVLNNKTAKRLTVTLDLLWRQSVDTLGQRYGGDSWEEYGPITMRPHEQSTYILARGESGKYKSRQLLKINVVSCA